MLAVVGLSCAGALSPQPAQEGAEPEEVRVPIGSWFVPGTQETLTTPEAIARMDGKRVVLLGEQHDRADHHLWQLQTIAALHARRQSVVLGFEMFPRSAQPVLDRWVRGELTEQQFLAESGWRGYWKFPPELYLPLFRFARMNRVPMVALNVARTLVSRAAREEWQDIPEEEREGLSLPAPALPEYERWLADLYGEHAEQDPHAAIEEEPLAEADQPAGASETAGDASAAAAAEVEEQAHGHPHAATADDAGLRGFIRGQLVWDRAFAEGIHVAARAHPDALVMGIVGAGHLQYGYGVPHQLAALGVKDVAVFLPWEEPSVEEETDEASTVAAVLEPHLADALFGVEPAAAMVGSRRLLGIFIEEHEAGVAVRQVSAGSVAESAGIRSGDIVVQAAGVPVKEPGDLQEIVARQAAGTWLPLRVQRHGAEIEIVAKFPPEP